jgi:ATP-dependent Clp protease ATP-binding subunit ClpC
MATRMCDVCGIRPAVVTVRRIVPGEGQRVEHLCEIHAAEAGVNTGRSGLGESPLGGSPLGGGSLFDDFVGRFFDDEPLGGTRRMGSPSSRQAEQVDITQYFSDSTTNLLQRAAQQALEWGNLDLTSEHLLYAALEDTVVRRVLDEVGADPEAIRAQLEEEAEKGGRTDVSPSLAPDAKRALLAAYDESRALGVSYIGPEHVLLALAADGESEAGRLLARFGLSHTRLRGAVVRGVNTGGEAREPASSTPTLEEYSRDLTQMAREGKLDPVIGRADEVETTIEILSRRTKNNPVLIGDPGVGKPPSWRA